MCRLYAMHANEPTRVECGLVKAQNALMAQSRGDAEGLMHGHGWGVADYPDGGPIVEKQTWAAFHGEHFKRAAARIHARTAVAHVRRATVGPPSIVNTHPFHHGRWIFAHNGTVPNFAEVRLRLLEETDPLHRSAIKGETDSEHIFHYLLSLHSRQPSMGLLESVRHGLNRIITWCTRIDPVPQVGLNVVLTDGTHLFGSRFNRTLHYLRRDHLHECSVCGSTHVQHRPGKPYRAVEVASEPVTHDEHWEALPNGVVFQSTAEFRLDFQPLSIPAVR